jgi:hypothetical protein
MNETNEPPIADGSLGDTDTLPFSNWKSLLDRGFHIFPLGYLSKIPLKDFHWKEEASNDPDKVSLWSVLYKWGNLAVACEPSNLVVIDLDKFKGQEIPEKYRLEGVTDASDILCVELEKIGRFFPTDTYSVHTPSGGRHLYYRNEGAPISNATSVNGMTGIDIRGVGGYVVAEGSRSEKGLYLGLEPKEIKTLDDELREIITPKKSKPIIQSLNFVSLSSPNSDPYRLAGMRNEIDKVRKAQEGKRNSTLFSSSCAVGELVADDLSLLDEAVRGLVEAGITAGLTQYESETTTERGIREGLKTPRSRKNVSRSDYSEPQERSISEGSRSS